ncbi:MAG: hypothetical protein ACI81P_002946 [Neolewinella sp.]
MSLTNRLLTLGFLCLLATSLAAQTNYDGIIDVFVGEHDAQVSAANSARITHAAVTLRINEANELEAIIDNEEQIRITLQRDGASDMDALFPLTIDSAIIIITNETTVIIDPVEQMHFALSLFTAPKLPYFDAEPTLVFEGYGLSRHWGKAGGFSID